MRAPGSATSATANAQVAPRAQGLGSESHSDLQDHRVIERLEQIITQDPGGRGLAGAPGDNPVTRCRGSLEQAARHIASDGDSVAIVTGFYVDHTDRPTIETDGPCGAIALACLLGELGFRVRLITDPLGEPAVAAALVAGAVRTASLDVFPFDDPEPSSSVRASNDPQDSRLSLTFVESLFRSESGGQLTHLVAVERAGPSHWRHSQTNWTAAELSQFANLCPPEHQNQVHNFQGRIISAYTAKTHLLFEFVRDNNLPVRTIGIGDGGNEIGMGSVPWLVLHANISRGLGARIACRVATDWTIACGVSNWGAYALAAAVASLRGRPEILAEWSDDREGAVMGALVAAGAVDGITGRPEPSVDGMPLEQHLIVWDQIRVATRPFASRERLS